MAYWAALLSGNLGGALKLGVRLKLTLLGGFQAQLDAGAALVLPTRKTQALLAYLALPLGPARDRLARHGLRRPERGPGPLGRGRGRGAVRAAGRRRPPLRARGSRRSLSG